ncbi:Golgi-associated plant pathogenesis-related protein 1-like [Ixodes scapularis]|uniref:Golgi-associated plant pathogenesis-related protein 1-like n=1 Tax=Ixodes scapularis TaxID=6945 RepID=UPI001A9DAED6|nr:Golgi-associated plant pathogenesis-related protein 1-like [Ixodes scapularis]
MNLFSLEFILSVYLVLDIVVGQYHPTSWETDMAVFRKKCVDRHNYYRKLHRSPRLFQNTKINLWAQGWAEYIAGIDQMRHRDGNPYGENIYMIGRVPHGYQPKAKNVVDAWYKEIKYYNYSNPGFRLKTGHFTQVVWKATRRLGCGWARSYTGYIYVVCNYDPPGNFRNKFSENVLKP